MKPASLAIRWGGTLALLHGAAVAATLAGRIVEDHSGVPLPSAEVRVYRIGAPGLAADLETDGEGRFQASELPEGDYRIEVAKANHAGVSVRIRLTAADSSALDVRLIRFGVITGQVTDGQGQAVRGANVFAFCKPGGAAPPRPEFVPGRYAPVDSSGRYRIFNLPPGEYLLAASYGASTLAVGSTGNVAAAANVGSGVLFHPDNARPQRFTITGGEEFRGINFAIFAQELYSVSGKVETGSLQPEQGQLWLALAGVDQPAMAAAVTQARPDGGFRFEGIPRGSYHLFASGPSRARGGRGAELPPDAVFARARIEVTAQPIENVTLVPEKSRTASFVLDAAGPGCSAAGELVLTSLEDWAARLDRRVPISFHKAETVSGLAPARYLVTASGLGPTCFAAEVLLDLSAASRPEPLVIPVRLAGSVQGRLDTGGRPASGFVVVLVMDAADSGPAVQVTVPDAQSRFAFTAVRPGRYRLAVQPVTRQSRWFAEGAGLVEIEVAGGKATQITVAAPPPDGDKP